MYSRLACLKKVCNNCMAFDMNITLIYYVEKLSVLIFSVHNDSYITTVFSYILINRGVCCASS